MNTIVRSIIRGLLSGEINAEPQVFEHLRQLSERRLQGHTRILRLVRPAGAEVHTAEPRHAGDTLTDGSSSVEERPQRLRRSSTSHSFRRSWSTFANVSCGRWIRLTACLLAAGVVLGFGVADVQAGAIAAEGNPSAAGLTEMISMVWNGLQPFQHTLVLMVGLLLASWLAALGTQWYCRNKLFVMKPHEVALQQLESTQHRVDHGNVSDPRRAVLGILWNYVQEHYQLRLPEAGRDAILRALTQCPTLLSPIQKLLLRDVLDSIPDGPTDSLRSFAELNDKAILFVWATAGSRGRRQTTLNLAG